MFSCYRFPCVLVLKMTVIKPVWTVGMIARLYRWPSKVLIISVRFMVFGTTGQYGLLDCTSSRRRKWVSQSNNGTTSQYGRRDRTSAHRRKQLSWRIWYDRSVRSAQPYHRSSSRNIFITICLLFSFTFVHIKKLLLLLRRWKRLIKRPTSGKVS